MSPTYDYQCDTCGAQQPVTCSIHEQAQAPMCAGCEQTMRRTYSTPGVAFRGQGWGRNK